MRLTKAVILTGFILLKFFFQYLLISPEYELHRDEYLHIDQGNHPAWGYQSVPPFTSWTSYIILLLGKSVFWVKFFPALYGALTIVIVWKAIETQNGNLFALVLGSTCVLFSALLRMNTLYQPNSFDILCWTAFYYVVTRYLKSGNVKWFYTGAVIFALGFLNKYNIAFLLIGLLPAMLLTGHRKVFLKRDFYFSLLPALLLVSPNLIWQVRNDFPVLQHMRELSGLQLVNVSRIDFLKSQVLFFSGSLIVIVSAWYALWMYKPFKNYKVFLPALVFTLAAFLYFKAKDYYAIGIYPIYIAFGSAWLGNRLSQGWKWYLQPLLIVFPILLFIPVYQIAFPNKSPGYIMQHAALYKDLGLLRWEDGKDHEIPQDFADMLGWKELAAKADSVYSTVPENDNTLVLCDNYGQAGAINFYSKKGIQAVSFSADYIDWIDFDKKYRNLIRVKNKEERDNEWRTTSPFFQAAFIADSVTSRYSREYGATIFLFMNARIDLNAMIEAEVEYHKAGRK